MICEEVFDEISQPSVEGNYILPLFLVSDWIELFNALNDVKMTNITIN